MKKLPFCAICVYALLLYSCNGKKDYATVEPHWSQIRTLVIDSASQANADFETTIYAYAKTSIALFDGFIECWDEVSG